MKPAATATTAAREPAVLIYQLVCVAGLAAVLTVQLTQGLRLLGLMLFLVGLLGIASRMRLAPALFLLVLAGSQFRQQLYWGGSGWRWYNVSWTFRVSDVVQCCGALAYVLGHYRLQGLVDHLLPPDPRTQERPRRRFLLWRRPTTVWQRRSPRLVTPWELALLLLPLPFWAVQAQVFWAWLTQRGELLGLPPALARWLLLGWLLIVAGLLIASVLWYWRRRTMTPTEALLLLQDRFWRHTRSAQQHLNRWLPWARPASVRGKEMP